MVVGGGVQVSVALATLVRLALFAALLEGALLVFGRVRSEYQRRGALSRPTAILQVGYLCAYAVSSYAFIDARLSQTNTSSPILAIWRFRFRDRRRVSQVL